MKKATRVILMGMFLSLTFANKVNAIEVTLPEPNDSFYVLVFSLTVNLKPTTERPFLIGS